MTQAGPTVAPWVAAGASVLAALIAATAVLLQVRRTTSVQRELEREKLRGAERAAELAQERAERAQERDRADTHRREQVLPFLDALHATLNASYLGAYLPPHFPKLGGRIPQLKQHADRAMMRWLTANQEMSRHRMRLFLAIDPHRLEPLVGRLVDLQEQMQQVLETRHKLWFQAASERELWEAHREYVTIGYGVMMEVSSLVSERSAATEPALTDEGRRELAGRMALPLEKLSTATLPYGSWKDYTWLVLWDLDTSPGVLDFIEDMRQGTHAEFEEQLKSLAKALYDDENTIESALMRVPVGEEKRDIYCLTTRLASAADLDRFLEEGVPICRKRFPLLWSSLRQPVEFKFTATEKEAEDA